MRTNPKGVHAERWRHVHGCGRWFNALRDTVSDRILDDLPVGEPRPDAAGPGPRDDPKPYRLPTGGRDRPHADRSPSPSTAGLFRATTATRSPRRCSPTASTWSGARSSTTGRAASDRARARRSRTRWSRRSRAGRPRHAQPARDAGRALRRPRRGEPEPLAVAVASTSARSTISRRRSSRPASTTRPSCGPRSRSGRKCLRAGDPPRRRPRARAGRARSRPLRCTATPIATCWWSAPARRGSPPRSPPPATGARVMLCDEQAELGGSLLADARSRRSTARRRGVAAARHRPTLARPRQRHAAAAHHGLRLLHPQPRRASPSASPITSPRRRPTLPRERLWQVRARRGGDRRRARSSGRWCSPTTTGPGSCSPTRRAPIVNRYGVAPGRRARRRHSRRHRLRARRSTCARPASRSPRSSTCARTGGRRAEARARGRHPDRCRPRRSSARAGGCACAASVVARRRPGRHRRPASASPATACCMSGGWTPSVHLFSQSRGKVRFDEALDAFVPGRIGAGRALGRRLPRHLRPRGLPRRRLRGRRRGGRATPGSTPATAPSRPTRSRIPASGLAARCRHDRDPVRVKAFVDFQNDVTAKDLQARGPRGLPLDRARQALHHDGHGDRPGQDLEHERARRSSPTPSTSRSRRSGLTTFRPPYTPVTFGALAGPTAGDLFDPVRTHADPLTGRRSAARCSRTSALWKRARYFPRGGEDMHAAVARECRAVRDAVGIFDASHARQDRGRRPGCGRVPRTASTSTPGRSSSPAAAATALMLNEAASSSTTASSRGWRRDRFHVTTTTGGAPRVLAP